jgi:hypothetical protein
MGSPCATTRISGRSATSARALADAAARSFTNTKRHARLCASEPAGAPIIRSTKGVSHPRGPCTLNTRSVRISARLGAWNSATSDTPGAPSTGAACRSPSIGASPSTLAQPTSERFAARPGAPWAFAPGQRFIALTTCRWWSRLGAMMCSTGPSASIAAAVASSKAIGEMRARPPVESVTTEQASGSSKPGPSLIEERAIRSPGATRSSMMVNPT